MNHRALGSFGIALALAFTGSLARAQNAADTPQEEPSEDEGEDEQAEGAVSAEVKAEAAPTVPKAEASVQPSTATHEPEDAKSSVEEYQALRPPSYGKPGDWFIQPYGYARFDAIVDSTQSFDDGLQPYLIARAGTYKGDHRRAIFTARDSRFGIFVGAPPFHGIKTSGGVELDFYGLQVSDAKKHDQVVMGPLRLRLAYAKIETPAVDIIAGQYHEVFGWSSYFFPATVAYLGVPGEVYHRNPQFRIEKKIHAGKLELHTAVAVVRPGQRDAGGIPDGEAGIKLAHGGWSGIASGGFGRPAVTPVQLGVSGLYRHFEVPEFELDPGSRAQTTNGWGFAAQALLPVIPASSLEKKGNSLTFTGEFSMGTGIADMYTGMDGGSRLPLLPNLSANVAYVYPQNIDPGLVTFDRTWTVKTIDWTAFVVGAQYYLPIWNGNVWLSGVYSRVSSDNIKELTPAASWGGVFTKMEYIDASLGFAITPALLMGFSFQTLKQTFADVSAATPNYGVVAMDGQPGLTAGVRGTGGKPASARNNRGQFSVAFFF